MNISKEMIIDILENLSDDELRLFLEHLVNNNESAKESLYKYYVGLLNQKYIEKHNYKERVINEIKVDKIHPYAFVSFYELINNSIIKYDKNNDDFLYELIFESYIELNKKYSKIDFSDLFNYLDDINTSLSSSTLEIILNKISILTNKRFSLKLDLLTKLLKYISKEDISLYLDVFYSIYEINDNKELYLPLIDYLFIYLQKNYSKIKAIQFLEYFTMENYRINHTVVSFYNKNNDYEKALSILNKIPTSLLKENEYKDYLITKGNIYKELGSNTLYYKSLVDLILHNHFEYFDILKKEQKERDFKISLDFIIDNLKITNLSKIELLHQILKDNLSSYGLIKFYNYFPKDIIYEDILYFKELNNDIASELYEFYILDLASKIDSRPKLNSLKEHVIELYKNYNIKDIPKYLNKLKECLSNDNYKYIYACLLNEFNTSEN